MSCIFNHDSTSFFVLIVLLLTSLHYLPPPRKRLTQSTTRDGALTDGSILKHKLQNRQRCFGGCSRLCRVDCFSRCLGGCIRALCSATACRSIFGRSWRAIKDEHEIIAIFLSNPATARMSRSTYVVILGVRTTSTEKNGPHPVVFVCVYVRVCVLRLSVMLDSLDSGDSPYSLYSNTLTRWCVSPLKYRISFTNSI